jgi:hypothetical protein
LCVSVSVSVSVCLCVCLCPCVRFGDSKASEWSYLSSRLRSAAQLGSDSPHPMRFGGYLVPRGPTGGVAHGTPGLLMKALTLVGSGSKGFSWFEFGPEWSFPGNCFSAIGLHEEESSSQTDQDDRGIAAATTVENSSRHSIFAQIAEASRVIAAAEDLLYPGVTPAADVALLYPRSSFLWDNASAPHVPHGTEDPGLTAMGYQAVLAGLFKVLSQGENVALDFLDEDSLTPERLRGYKALVVTEPNVPAENQAAIVEWLSEGGHLLTMSSAAMYDRYDRPSALLSGATGFEEEPRPRLVVPGSQRLRPVANGTGALGRITAYGVRGRLRPTPPSATLPPFDTLARFSDSTASIVRRNNVSAAGGSATHFAYLPCVHFHNMDPYAPDHQFNNLSSVAEDDGSLPYLREFLARSGVQPRAYVSAPQVETPLLVSGGGAVITLLDWRTRSNSSGTSRSSSSGGGQQAQALAVGVDVRVLLDFAVARVEAVRAGVALRFNCTPADVTASASSGRRPTKFWVGFTVPQMRDGEMVKMYAGVKPRSPAAAGGE